MKRPKWLFTSALAVGLLSLTVAGRAALGTASGAKVSFSATGTMGLSFTGTTSELSVTDDGTNVVITVPFANMTTDNSLRDHHMKEKYLEVAKYPSATLTIARSALKVPAAGAEAAGDAPGTLNLHGQTKPVTVHYTAKGNGAQIDAQGSFHVNFNDYGISVPNYVGVTVKPDVDVSASFHVAGS